MVRGGHDLADTSAGNVDPNTEIGERNEFDDAPVLFTKVFNVDHYIRAKVPLS